MKKSAAVRSKKSKDEKTKGAAAAAASVDDHSLQVERLQSLRPTAHIERRLRQMILTDIDEDIVKNKNVATIECIIANKHHRTVMGYRGCNVQDISHKYSVNIKFPDKSISEGEEGGATGGVSTDDVVKISGREADCKSAEKALFDLLPVTECTDVTSDTLQLHDIMRACDVDITVELFDDVTSHLKITGTPANIKVARCMIEDRSAELAKLHAKWARNIKETTFQLEMGVKKEFHRKIVGRRGAVLNKLRRTHNVQIIVPDDNDDRIVIIGQEKQTRAAMAEMMQIVRDE